MDYQLQSSGKMSVRLINCWKRKTEVGGWYLNLIRMGGNKHSFYIVLFNFGLHFYKYKY